MPSSRHLPNAPILEALLDIRVVPRPDAKFEELASLRAHYRDKYPTDATKKQAGIQFEIDATTPEVAAKVTRSEPQLTGIEFIGSDKRYRIQVALGEFTQNVLGKYADFESLLSEAIPSWEAYVEVMRPLSISRIALRYVNDLRLPRDMAKFEDYLAVMPSVPPKLPQTLSDFAFRMTLHKPEVGAKAIVNEVFQGVVEEKGVQVLLDIDAIQERQIDIDDRGLWDRFAALRQFKNDIFFEFVTERLLEKYQ